MTSSDADSPTGGVANLQPVWESMEKEQRAWYWYDWANSAYVTTIATVLLSPYLISVAEKDACGKVTGRRRSPAPPTSTCWAWPSPPGSLVFYVITLSTHRLGPGAARGRRGRRPLGARRSRSWPAFAWAGSLAAAAAVLRRPAPTGSSGSLLLFIANICLGASLVVYDAILCQIALPDDRDKVSSRGWALGYLGGGLLLAVNLALVTFARLGRAEHRDGGADQHALRGHLVGGFHDHPLPGHPQPRAGRRGARAGWTGRGRASDSSGRR